jgi:hypothetical protein
VLEMTARGQDLQEVLVGMLEGYCAAQAVTTGQTGIDFEIVQYQTVPPSNYVLLGNVELASEWMLDLLDRSDESNLYNSTAVNRAMRDCARAFDLSNGTYSL